MDATLRIKNLSIALEALSRINTTGAYTASVSIGQILNEEIQAFREEKEKETQWPNRPAKPTPNPDDEIPF